MTQDAPARVLSVIVCGAGPAAAIGTLVKLARDRGWTVQVIATPAALDFFDQAAVEEQTGNPVRSQYSAPGESRSQVPDAIIVAPATYNTINKWALGISDTYALGVLAEISGLEQGLTVTVIPPGDVRSLDGYDAPGSAPPNKRDDEQHVEVRHGPE